MTLDTNDRRFALQQAQQAVPKNLRQRQDSLEAQLLTVVEMATRAGCYDAADHLKKVLEKRLNPGEATIRIEDLTALREELKATKAAELVLGKEVLHLRYEILQLRNPG